MISQKQPETEIIVKILKEHKYMYKLMVNPGFLLLELLYVKLIEE